MQNKKNESLITFERIKKLEDVEISYPWQETPSRLIFYALDYFEQDADFDHQVGFLLLDVGIETLFKIYLLLDEKITGSHTGFHKRKEAVKGSFHNLVEIVKESSGNIIDDDDFEKVKYFHGVRNKLYHQGDGVKATNKNISQYSELAVKLLRLLLDVNLEKEKRITKDIGDEEWIEELRDSMQRAHEERMHNMFVTTTPDAAQTNFQELQCNLAAITGHLYPKLATRNFEEKLSQILEKYYHAEERAPYSDEPREIRNEDFGNLTGLNTMPDWFISNALKDINYLRLAVVLSTKHDDNISSKDLNMYITTRNFVQSSNEHREDFDWLEKKQALSNDIAKWVEEILEDIDSLFDKKNIDMTQK